MIDARYVLTMARYNAWQNRQIIEIVKTMDKEALTLDRGVFFGSISRTLNHLLWADTLWMSRLCSDVPAPEPGGDTTDITIWICRANSLGGRKFTTRISIRRSGNASRICSTTKPITAARCTRC